MRKHQPFLLLLSIFYLLCSRIDNKHFSAVKSFQSGHFFIYRKLRNPNFHSIISVLHKAYRSDSVLFHFIACYMNELSSFQASEHFATLKLLYKHHVCNSQFLATFSFHVSGQNQEFHLVLILHYQLQDFILNQFAYNTAIIKKYAPFSNSLTSKRTRIRFTVRLKLSFIEHLLNISDISIIPHFGNFTKYVSTHS